MSICKLIEEKQEQHPLIYIEDNAFEHVLCDFPLSFLLLEWFAYRKNQYCWRGTVYTKWEGMN